jgi:hypothetical protein
MNTSNSAFSSSASTSNAITLETLPPIESMSPDLQRAIRQFQQVLWTPSMPKAISILNAHPLVLSHQNRIGFLPLHKAIKCTRSDYRSEIIKLIIEHGIQNNVGGPHGRGGLLVRSDDKRRSGLCLLVVGDDKTDILEYLITRDPPLLSSQDVIDYNLLHCAAGDPFLFKDRVNTIRFLIDLCPQALRSRNSVGDLPIHHLCKQPGYSLQMLQMFLQEGVLNGVFLEKDGRGRPFLRCCIENHSIPLLRSLDGDNTYRNSPILQGIIGVSSQKSLRTIIDTFENFKHWCCARDSQGRLPLHTAVQYGLKWDDEVEDILNANVFAASDLDPVTNLYPFLLAACSTGKQEGYDLNSIYQLARCNPNCVGFQSKTTK